MKSLLAALLFVAVTFIVFSETIPHQGESLSSLIKSELRWALHSR